MISSKSCIKSQKIGNTHTILLRGVLHCKCMDANVSCTLALLAFLLVALFGSSLLHQSLIPALTLVHTLISTEDPTSTLIEKKECLFSFPCKLNCRNHDPFLFLPPEKPLFCLNTHPLSLYSICHHRAAAPVCYSSMHFQLPHLVTVSSQTHAHTHPSFCTHSLDSLVVCN